MSEPLSERLRAYAKDQGGWLNIDDTCEEAANLIDALAAERDKLRDSYLAFVTAITEALDASILGDLTPPDDYLISKAKAIRAERDRLRDALERIERMDRAYEHDLFSATRVAREALARAKGESAEGND